MTNNAHAGSALTTERRLYRPKIPAALRGGAAAVGVDEGPVMEPSEEQERLAQQFPHCYGLPVLKISDAAEGGTIAPIKVGVILSGGQAAGGHNVIAGLYDGLKSLNPDNGLVGFIGGPSGLVNNEYMDLSGGVIDIYRNTGGFDMIGSGRTKLDKAEQFDKVIANCREHGITGIVIIGGDDSNTNACVMAEYFCDNAAGIQVVGCPKTIDGDLKSEAIEASFGFDTACKVFSELIGNIARDSLSAGKYWHFIRLMGRSASHIALECALQTRPNVTLISEEVAARGDTLTDITRQIAGVVAERAANGDNFGVALIPEGLIEFIPEMNQLIGELNDILARAPNAFDEVDTYTDRDALAGLGLTDSSVSAWLTLPPMIRRQLVIDRDPHGNVQVSKIETERLLIDLVAARLDVMQAEGTFIGEFSAQNHFFGYEGRCAFPSNFDTDYGYTLGTTAAVLLGSGRTGYIAAVSGLAGTPGAWQPAGIPLTALMTVERRHGTEKAVIRKALVDLDGPVFAVLQANREEWAVQSEYRYPGPIQYYGPDAVCDAPTMTLRIERG